MCALTTYLLAMYSLTHWNLCDSANRLRAEIISIGVEQIQAQDQHAAAPSPPDGHFKRITALAEELSSSSARLLNLLEAYHFTGAWAFICGIVAVMRRPRWIGLIGLAFGLIGLILAAIVM